jgi:hypothetical protein
MDALTCVGVLGKGFGARRLREISLCSVLG